MITAFRRTLLIIRTSVMDIKNTRVSLTFGRSGGAGMKVRRTV